MNMLAAFALLTSGLAALAFYLSSPRCLWTSIHRWRTPALISAAVLTAGSTDAWITSLGVAAGLCAMLGTSMLCLVVSPWVALFTSGANATGHD